jgi:hypothetical protein
MLNNAFAETAQAEAKQEDLSAREMREVGENHNAMIENCYLFAIIGNERSRRKSY